MSERDISGIFSRRREGYLERWHGYLKRDWKNGSNGYGWIWVGMDVDGYGWVGMDRNMDRGCSYLKIWIK